MGEAAAALEVAIARAIAEHGRAAPGLIATAIVSRRWIDGGWKARSIAEAIASVPAPERTPEPVMAGQLSLLDEAS